MRTETDNPNQPDESFYRRSEQMRRWGALLLVLGLIWLVFALVSRISFGSLLGNSERQVDLAPQSFTASRVVISGVNDTLTITSGTDQVNVEATKYGFGWNMGAAEAALQNIDLHTEQRGDTVMIEVRRQRGLSSLTGRTPFIALQIAIPPGVTVEGNLVSGAIQVRDLRGNADFTSISGDIQIEQMQGDVTINTASGDIELDAHDGTLTANSVSGDIQASGSFRTAKIDTTSGDVALEGVSGAIQITTISGAISISAASAAELAIETTSGDIRFAGEIGGDGQVSSISGDVVVGLDPRANLRIDARTVSGDLAADEVFGALQRERRSLTGTLGAGGPLLTISTVSGNVELRD